MCYSALAFVIGLWNTCQVTPHTRSVSCLSRPQLPLSPSSGFSFFVFLSGCWCASCFDSSDTPFKKNRKLLLHAALCKLYSVYRRAVRAVEDWVRVYKCWHKVTPHLKGKGEGTPHTLCLCILLHAQKSQRFRANSSLYLSWHGYVQRRNWDHVLFNDVVI